MPDFAARRETMVDTQVRPADVTRYPIIAAMLAVAREHHVPPGLREAAYADQDLAIAPGRALMAPRSFAKMLDALDLRPAEIVLDVGAGLGYGPAVLARLVDTVVAIESDPALAAEAERVLAADGVDTVAVIAGPLEAGAARHGPYDAIVIEGAAEVVPEAILGQLKDGGRIAAIFVNGPVGVCRIGVRAGDSIGWRDAFNATAPLLPGFARPRSFAL
ncbi:MAG: protein-L-isoaspartate O-methyltransferase family protein [Gemmobacter sp.]